MYRALRWGRWGGDLCADLSVSSVSASGRRRCRLRAAASSAAVFAASTGATWRNETQTENHHRFAVIKPINWIFFVIWIFFFWLKWKIIIVKSGEIPPLRPRTRYWCSTPAGRSRPWPRVRGATVTHWPSAEADDAPDEAGESDDEDERDDDHVEDAPLCNPRPRNEWTCRPPRVGQRGGAGGAY